MSEQKGSACSGKDELFANKHGFIISLQHSYRTFLCGPTHSKSGAYSFEDQRYNAFGPPLHSKQVLNNSIY